MRAWEALPFSSQMVIQCACVRETSWVICLFPNVHIWKCFCMLVLWIVCFLCYSPHHDLTIQHSVRLYLLSKVQCVLTETNTQTDVFLVPFLKGGGFVHSVGWSLCWIWHSKYPDSYPELWFSGQYIVLFSNCCTCNFHYQEQHMTFSSRSLFPMN